MAVVIPSVNRTLFLILQSFFFYFKKDWRNDKARTVRRAVKSVNERDPHPMLLLPASAGKHSWGTARDKWEEGVGDGTSVYSGITPSDSADGSPYCLGLHATYSARYNGMQPRKGKQIP